MANFVREIKAHTSADPFRSFQFMSLNQALKKTWKTPAEEQRFRELIPLHFLFARLIEEAFLPASQFDQMRLSLTISARRTPTFLQRFGA